MKKGNGICRVYPFEETEAPKRTHESIVGVSLEASETTSNRVKGMLGCTAFIYLTYLSLVNNIVVDYMHGCLLGV